MEPLKDSNVLVVSYESGDPRLSSIVLGQLLEQYLAHHVEVHRQGDVEPFFEAQAGRSRRSSRATRMRSRP